MMFFSNDELRINTKQQTFDIRGVQNRRFMYNPNTGTLLLGRHIPNDITMDFRRDHERMGNKEPYDDFIRGIVGYGGEYKNGVIHFISPIEKTEGKRFNDGYSTLKMFARNGAEDDTVVRGFPRDWEQPLSKVIKAEKIITEEKQISVRRKR